MRDRDRSRSDRIARVACSVLYIERIGYCLGSRAIGDRSAFYHRIQVPLYMNVRTIGRQLGNAVVVGHIIAGIRDE